MIYKLGYSKNCKIDRVIIELSCSATDSLQCSIDVRTIFKSGTDEPQTRQLGIRGSLYAKFTQMLGGAAGNQSDQVS